MPKDKESELLAARLNKEVVRMGSMALYEAMVSIIRKKSSEIYDDYERSGSNPLATMGRGKFIEKVETERDSIFTKVQNETKAVINSALGKKLSAQQVERFAANLKRETWNFVYEKYARRKTAI
jgi:hypothetical protein